MNADKQIITSGWHIVLCEPTSDIRIGLAQPVDLPHGMENRRMIPLAKPPANFWQRFQGELFREIRRYLSRLNDVRCASGRDDIVSGHSEVPRNHRLYFEPFLAPIKTAMDGGNVRLRSRPGDDTSIVTQTVAMTKAQYDTLVTWGKGTIGNWTGRFSVNVWLGSSCAVRVCQFEDGAPKPSSFSANRIAVRMTLRVAGS